MATPNSPKHVWGSLWWQAPTSGTYFKLRCGITPRYAQDANAALPPDTEPYLWLPLGEKPHPTARTWANF